MPIASVVLKPRRAKPFFLRHPWVFSGAVGRVVGAPTKGDIVRVTDADGRFVGWGLYNAESQIVARLFSWEEEAPDEETLWRERIQRAVRLRREVLRLDEATDACRLVYSDSDGLPGLIVDRYAEALAVQFLTAGMALRRGKILDLLQEILSPVGIFESGDEEAEAKEGIPSARGVARGRVPEGPVEVHADGMRFLVELRAGQKTGFYLDQRENRLTAARYMKGRTVLDAFCYTGAFGIAACRLGRAAGVVALDGSQPALDLARRNFDLNGIAPSETVCGQVSVELRKLKSAGRRFGAVILDPPKFARTRDGMARAMRAYRDANLMAMQLLEPEGVLVTCSCSGHVSPDDFLMMLNDAANEAGVLLQVLERRGQSADHPVIASCPETAYLKCFIGRVAPR